MSFINDNYEVPVNYGDYLNKFEEGETDIRIMSEAIMGWEGWQETTNEKGEKVRKPVRFHMNEKPTDLRPFDKQRVNHFWAMIIWNYKAQKIQILQITQKTIQEGILALYRNSKWGDPKEYDLTISRKGKTVNDTEYAVIPNPHTRKTIEMGRAFQDRPINLEALFAGLDPFDPNLEIKAQEDFDAFDDQELPPMNDEPGSIF
jgi:hypothetical protein